MNIIAVISIIFVLLLVILIGSIVGVHIINKHLVFHHHVTLSIDNAQIQKHNEKHNENFEIVSDISNQSNNESLKMTNKCSNASLNELHKSGNMSTQDNPFQILCKNSSHDKMGIYKPPMYDDYNNNILGSNYMSFNTNPNPYHLDYPLYSSDENNIPVGVNVTKL